MGEKPITRAELEALYWVTIDFLLSGLALDDVRRARLRKIAVRLSEQVLYLDGTDIEERLRIRLLSQRLPDEVGKWAVYGEDIVDDPRKMLLTVIEGTYDEAVEGALNEPGFITHGMGGQIDPLGLDD